MAPSDRSIEKAAESVLCHRVEVTIANLNGNSALEGRKHRVICFRAAPSQVHQLTSRFADLPANGANLLA